MARTRLRARARLCGGLDELSRQIALRTCRPRVADNLTRCENETRLRWTPNAFTIRVAQSFQRGYTGTWTTDAWLSGLHAI